MRSGDIGDEAGRSAGDAGPLDLDAVRADDDLIEALAAGLVPPPCGPRDPSDVEGELVALLAGWVADVRPETLLHPVPSLAGVQVLAAAESAESRSAEDTTEDSHEDDVRFAAVCSGMAADPSSQPLSLLEHNEVTRPVGLAAWRSRAARPYLLRAAAALVAVALVGSAVVAQSYDAHPGEPLWAIAKMVFPAKSHSVEAASEVSTALNTARVALENGRIDEAREAFQTVAAQLGDVYQADGRAELDHQRDYLSAQLSAAPATTATATEPATPNAADRPLATGSAGAVIPSSPTVTPGATAALSTPSTVPPPAVLAAPPGVTSEGSPAPAEASSPAPDAVLAAPPPFVDPAPAPPPAPSASVPAVDPTAVSAPPVDPVNTAPATTAPPSPTKNPSGGDPTSDPPQPTDPPGPAGDTAANVPASDNATAPDNNTNTNADNNSKSNDSTQGADSASAQSPASDSSAVAAAQVDVSIDTNGAAGSTLGQVTGVVTDTAAS